MISASLKETVQHSAGGSPHVGTAVPINELGCSHHAG